MLRSIIDWFAARAAGAGDAAGSAARAGAAHSLSCLAAARRPLVVLGILGAVGYFLYTHLPVATVGRGEIGVRANRLTGGVSEWREGSVFVVPGVHELRRYSL